MNSLEAFDSDTQKKEQEQKGSNSKQTVYSKKSKIEKKEKFPKRLLCHSVCFVSNGINFIITLINKQQEKNTNNTLFESNLIKSNRGEERRGQDRRGKARTGALASACWPHPPILLSRSRPATFSSSWSKCASTRSMSMRFCSRTCRFMFSKYSSMACWSREPASVSSSFSLAWQSSIMRRHSSLAWLDSVSSLEAIPCSTLPPSSTPSRTHKYSSKSEFGSNLTSVQLFEF